jgi:lipopolysaccharide cholinephosphotransferase
MRKLRITIVVLLFCLNLEGYKSRLLVDIDTKASFSAEEFAKASSASLVKIDPRNPFIAFYPLFLDQSFVVASDPIEKRYLRRLSERYGYRYIHFSEESLEEAVNQAQHLLEKNPKYSSEIPSLSLDQSQRIYRLMQKIDEAFTRNGITYWAGSGTLLGAIRHGGLIPWDNDLDLYMLDTDETKLEKFKKDLDESGLVIHYYWKDLYKIFEKDAVPIQDPDNPDQLLPFCFPAADIFVMTLEKRHEIEDVYIHRSYDFYWHWNTERFTYSQIKNISRIPFGPISICIPGDPEAHLNAVYGTSEYPDLWKKYAFEPTWDHQKEDLYPYQGSLLVEIDEFSPAPW